MSAIKMFLRIEPEPPKVTHQQQKTVVRNGRPFRYEDARLKEARAMFTRLLSNNRPSEPLSGALSLDAKWIFCRPASKKGLFKTTKPDCDNLMKLVLDCMTALGYWEDDAQIAVLGVQKLWLPAEDEHGVYISVEEIKE